MNSQSVRVIKVGGSLFDFPNLVPALRRFLGPQPAASNVLIAGGGPWADAVRTTCVCQDLDERAAHWLCVRAMSLTARLLASLSPDWKLQTSWDALRSWTQQSQDEPCLRIFDVEPFLACEETRLPGRILPRDWTATSDSIAARVACCLEGVELVLLKSASLTPGTPIDKASETGYVDRFFPRAAEGLQRVRCVNLRDAGFSQTVWNRP